MKDPEKPGTNVTGTTDMNPIDKQLDLLLKIVPKARTIGILYNSSEINSQIQVKKMKELAEAKGLTVREATVSSVNDIQQSAQSLVGQVDAIYVPTDNVIASAMPVLAKITNGQDPGDLRGKKGWSRAGLWPPSASTTTNWATRPDSWRSQDS